jgi:hypothetical protein
MGFLIALCAISALCFGLLTRADRIRAERRLARRPSGGSRGDGRMSASSDTSSSDTFGLASWFSGNHSSSCSYDSSGNPADFGSCDGPGDSGGGGGDCGGGGGGID